MSMKIRVPFSFFVAGVSPQAGKDPWLKDPGRTAPVSWYLSTRVVFVKGNRKEEVLSIFLYHIWR
jgi:hypothetical protein